MFYRKYPINVSVGLHPSAMRPKEESGGSDRGASDRLVRESYKSEARVLDRHPAECGCWLLAGGTQQQRSKLGDPREGRATGYRGTSRDGLLGC